MKKNTPMLSDTGKITNYKFSVKHNTYSRNQIRSMLLAQPFSMLPLSPYQYVLEKPIDINQRLLRVHIRKGELVFALEWPYSVSEKYLDYLVQASIMIGRILSAMEIILEGSSDWKLEADADEEGADDCMTTKLDKDQDLLDLDEDSDYDDEDA